MEKLLLIDGNSIAYRAYFATAYRGGNILQTRDGIPTNAILSFANMLISALNKLKPTHVLIAFDKGKITRRHDLYPEYKAGRNKTPSELIQQLSLIRELVTKMGIIYYELEGWEADDIIASMSRRTLGDMQVEVMSSDRDLYQLINENTSMIINKTGLSNIVELTNDNFVEKLGYQPSQVVDIKGLAGDASDNLKGVRGIGEKGAIKLLSKYGNLENIYQNIDEIKGAIHDKLVNDKESAFLCKNLAILNYEINVPFEIAEMEFNIEMSDELLQFLQRYELKSLITKLTKFVNSKQISKFNNIII